MLPFVKRDNPVNPKIVLKKTNKQNNKHNQPNNKTKNKYNLNPRTQVT